MINENFETLFQEIFERERRCDPNIQASDESRYRDFYFKLFDKLDYIHQLDEAIDRYEKSAKSSRKYHLVSSGDGFLERQPNPYYKPPKPANPFYLHYKPPAKQPLINYCPTCGYKLSGEFTFCPKCGNCVKNYQ